MTITNSLLVVLLPIKMQHLHSSTSWVILTFINHGINCSDSITSAFSQNIGVFKQAAVENNSAGDRWTKCLDLADWGNYKLKK